MPVVRPTVSPTLPIPQIPIEVQPLSAKLLFKEAAVSATVLQLSPPQTFADVTIHTNTPAFLYFRDAVVTPDISKIITPDIFSNIKAFSQIR